MNREVLVPMPHGRIIRQLVIAVIATALLAACTGRQKIVYQPYYTPLDASDISGAMGRFAASIRLLEEQYGVQGTPNPRQREAIIDELRRMEDIAVELGSGPTQTNHLFIDEHIDDFKSEVRRARLDVEGDPPSYYRAGRLAGSCRGCHRLR